MWMLSGVDEFRLAVCFELVHDGCHANPAQPEHSLRESEVRTKRGRPMTPSTSQNISLTQQKPVKTTLGGGAAPKIVLAQQKPVKASVGGGNAPKIVLAQQKPVKASVGGGNAPKIVLAQQKPVKASVGGANAPKIVLAQQKRGK